MPKCRFLFACDLGDPISSVYVNEGGCMAGTMLGKVWLHTFEHNHVEQLTAFSDEGVRGLFLDEESAFATLTEGCRGWKRAPPNMQIPPVSFSTLDKNKTQNMKHVLQRGPLACVLFPLSSSVVNVQRQEHHHHSFKLFDYGSTFEVAPCDYDGTKLILVDRAQSASQPVFRLVHLERNEHIEVSNVPQASGAILIKLFSTDCLVYAIGGTLYVYDFMKQALKHTLRGGNKEVVAIDATDPEIIACVYQDAAVRLWSGITGQCKHSLIIPEANFFLGYPYFMSFCGNRVLVSADEGVYLVEFDSPALQARAGTPAAAAPKLPVAAAPAVGMAVAADNGKAG